MMRSAEDVVLQIHTMPTTHDDDHQDQKLS